MNTLHDLIWLIIIFAMVDNQRYEIKFDEVSI